MYKNLQQLSQGFYFRQAIPADLRPKVGARELRIALGTSDRAEADFRSSILRPFVSRLLRQLRENDRSMDIRDIRAHAVAHCNRQLEALGIALKEQVRQRTQTKASVAPSELAQALLASLPTRVHGPAWADIEQAKASITTALDQFDYGPVQAEAQQLAQRLGIDADSPNFLALCDEMLRNYLHVVEQAQRLSERMRIDFLPEELPRPPQPVAGMPDLFMATPTITPTGKRLSVWVEEFLRDIADRLPEDRDDGDYRAALEVLLVGAEDCDASLLTHKAVRAVSALLLKLPAHRTKKPHLKGKTVAELLALQLPPQDCISGTTIDKYSRYVNQFLDWLHKDQRVIPNYQLERPKGKKQTKTVSYSDFNPAQLAKLLAADSLLRELDVAHFWAPLIGAYSGMRLGEIAYLRANDVVKDDETGIVYFNTQNMGDEDEDGVARTLKTENSYRKVPVHAALLEIGLLDYLHRITTPEVPNPYLLGQEWKPLSKWFNRDEPNRKVWGYRSRCGVPNQGDSGGRLVFHSFRHSAITAARHGNALDATLKCVFGHEVESSTTDRYTHKRLPDFKKVIDQIDYQLDHSGLAGMWRSWTEAQKKFIRRQSRIEFLEAHGWITNSQ